MAAILIRGIFFLIKGANQKIRIFINPQKPKADLQRNFDRNDFDSNAYGFIKGVKMTLLDENNPKNRSNNEYAKKELAFQSKLQ
ncbi:hypothetical protein [Flavobacterium reichenbachii]|uniref:Uncharacterized protein n=1 Tax=Flavobacterium reichenbachii TaxID=362418 RepID=A0A085ZI24_9FLAO|nr:hypothetical protein [Flavobacterium reichenbachii]KFF04088.1 hypothetical protein IW19_00430 [Flavobacterium reichenbachii]OXB15869.1 hypothetical protein B0A68_09420 [Flavobacterium reichenbachii]